MRNLLTQILVGFVLMISMAGHSCAGQLNKMISGGWVGIHPLTSWQMDFDNVGNMDFPSMAANANAHFGIDSGMNYFEGEISNDPDLPLSSYKGLLSNYSPLTNLTVSGHGFSSLGEVCYVGEYHSSVFVLIDKLNNTYNWILGSGTEINISCMVNVTQQTGPVGIGIGVENSTIETELVGPSAFSIEKIPVVLVPYCLSSSNWVFRISCG